MAILSSSSFPAIRAALDITIDESDLPDTIIAMPMYAFSGESAVLQIDPLAETRTGAELQHIKLAAIYFTAGLLAPMIPQITKFQAGSVASRTSYERTIDWNAQSDYLFALADAEMNAVLTPSTQVIADRPLGFALAASGRSWQPPPLPPGIVT